jgi:hypothetical protein
MSSGPEENWKWNRVELGVSRSTHHEGANFLEMKPENCFIRKGWPRIANQKNEIANNAWRRWWIIKPFTATGSRGKCAKDNNGYIWHCAASVITSVLTTSEVLQSRIRLINQLLNCNQKYVVLKVAEWVWQRGVRFAHRERHQSHSCFNSCGEKNRITSSFW